MTETRWCKAWTPGPTILSSSRSIRRNCGCGFPEELRVRVRAGERILRLEEELDERNDRLNRINHTPVRSLLDHP